MGIPIEDLFYWIFFDLPKFQITNPKKQTNNNDQNSKSQTKIPITLNRFGICVLFVIWYLEFVILATKHQDIAIYHCPGPKDQIFQDKIKVETGRVTI